MLEWGISKGCAAAGVQTTSIIGALLQKRAAEWRKQGTAYHQICRGFIFRTLTWSTATFLHKHKHILLHTLIWVNGTSHRLPRHLKVARQNTKECCSVSEPIFLTTRKCVVEPQKHKRIDTRQDVSAISLRVSILGNKYWIAYPHQTFMGSVNEQWKNRP